MRKRLLVVIVLDTIEIEKKTKKTGEIHLRCEHVLDFTHLIDKNEEEEEEATDIKCRIKTATPCY
jgi:hypothetical protein